MTEIYHALERLDCQWKRLDAYWVRCRWCPRADANFVKVGLQLYKVQQNIYLLDFQKIDGDAFSFMHLCARIISALKTLSAARART